MATPTPPIATTDLRSGGKMVRPRRPAGPRTPYDRPFSSPLSPSPSNSLTNHPNPNWLSRFIFSPTRILAKGAGKVLTSVFRSGSGSDSDSDSDSNSDSDSASDDDMNDGDDDNAVSFQGDERIAEKKSAMVTEEPLVIEWKSETKCEIARLLMQETFSREECDRLTSIINSRVLDTDISTPDLHNAAVLEARKWLEEKKSGSSSKSVLDYETCVLNSDMVPREDEAGSPVDLAKSYMRLRPPWTSPTNQVSSPASISAKILREETSSVGGNSALSSKNSMKRIRDPAATGSWSMLEELRKVRSRATEEMLRTRPSSKIDWSALASDHQRRPNLLLADEVAQGAEVEIHSSKKLMDVSPTSSIGVTNDFTAAQPAQPASVPDQSHLPQGTGIVLALASSTNALSNLKGASHHGKRFQTSDNVPVSLSNVAATEPTEGTMLVTDHGGAVTANGFPSQSRQEREKVSRPPPDAAHSVAVISGHDKTTGSVPLDKTVKVLSKDFVEVTIMQENDSTEREKISRPPPDVAHNIAVISSNDKTMGSVPLDETIKVLSEDSVDVPIMQENDSVANGSQDSSSFHTQGMAAKEQTRPILTRRKANKDKEFSKYNNRGGKGRGGGQGQVQVRGQGQAQLRGQGRGR